MSDSPKDHNFNSGSDDEVSPSSQRAVHFKPSREIVDRYPGVSVDNDSPSNIMLPSSRQNSRHRSLIGLGISFDEMSEHVPTYSRSSLAKQPLLENGRRDDEVSTHSVQRDINFPFSRSRFNFPHRPASSGESTETTERYQSEDLNAKTELPKRRWRSPPDFSNIHFPQPQTPEPMKPYLGSPFRTPPNSNRKSSSSPGEGNISPPSIFSSPSENGTPGTVITNRSNDDLTNNSDISEDKDILDQNIVLNPSQSRSARSKYDGSGNPQDIEEHAEDVRPVTRSAIEDEAPNQLESQERQGRILRHASVSDTPDDKEQKGNANADPRKQKNLSEFSAKFPKVSSQSIRDRRRQKESRMRGKHFGFASNLRRDSDDPSLRLGGFRRSSMPNAHDLAYSNIDLDAPPSTAPLPPVLESYGPFEAMFSDRDSDNATLDEKLERRNQRMREDLMRARENTYIKLTENLYLPTQLLRVIAKRKKNEQIQLADFDNNSKISSHDELQAFLKVYEAAQVNGSEFISEHLSGGPTSQAEGSTNQTTEDAGSKDENIIRKSIGICFDLLRLNWEIIPENEFYKVEWSVGGKFQVPKLKTLTNKLNQKIADMTGLGLNILKWVLELLAFLCKAAGDCLLIPYREARQLVKSIRDTIRGIHVPVDYIGEECRQIWDSITSATGNLRRKAGGTSRKAGGPSRKAARWSERQINGARSLEQGLLQDLESYKYLFWVVPIMLLILRYSDAIFRILNRIWKPHISVPDISVPDISIPDISIPDISLPDVSLPHIGDLGHRMLSHHWITRIKSAALSTLQMLFDTGLLPFFCLATLGAVWKFRHNLWHEIRRSYTFIIALPTLILDPLSRKFGGQTDAARNNLRNVVNLLDIRSKIKAVRGSLPWLLPFVLLVVTLGRYGSLEKAKEFATNAARGFLDLVEGVLETIVLYIQGIPFESIRNILLNFCLWVLGLFYRWKDALAPYIGMTSVLASIVITAVVLDQVFGSGHFWIFLLRLRDSILNLFAEIPNVFGWLFVNLKIISNHYWERLLESNLTIVNSLRDLYQTVKEKVLATYDFLAELFRDCRDIAWDCLEKRSSELSHANFGKPLGAFDWWTFCQFIGMHVARWMAQALAVAFGVWLALFVCGMCLSCSKDGCFTRNEDAPDGLYGIWWSIQQTMAASMSEQKEVFAQIGHTLATLVNRSEARDERDEMLAQSLERITLLLEERNRGWFSRTFGF